MVRLSGAALGLLAFSVAIIQGLAAGNPVEVILGRAIWALLLFCVLGLIVGYVAQRVLDEHTVRRHGELFKEVEEAPNDSEPPTKPDQQAGSQVRAAGATEPLPNRTVPAG
ncbi:MAG: hypothetical protein GXY55_14545 [Phycisphaerae bacterium]|nr:hypothetical protein [Phycisphaerae bacterium]